MNGKRKGWFKKKGAGGEIVAGATVNLDAGNASSYPGSGTTWFDLSGNSHDGLLVGGVTYSASNGGILDFNGSTGTINMPETYEIDGNPFTVEMWFNLDSLPSAAAVNWLFQIKLNTGALVDMSWFAALMGSNYHSNFGVITFGSQTSHFEWRSVKMTESISASTWYQMVIVYDGVDPTLTSSFKFYLNEISKTLGDSSGYTDDDNTNYIASEDGDNGFVDGKIPIYNFYNNKEFNQTEVTQNFDFYKSRFGL